MAGRFMGSRLPSAASRYANENYNEPNPEQNEGAALALIAQQATEDLLAQSDEVGQLAQDGEELATVYGEVLPEVQQVLDDAQEAGGISVEAVSLLAIIGNLTGTDLSANVATESYGTSGRSAQATRLAMEAVSDRMKGWWQALKRWLKRVWQKAKDWWNKTFSGAASVKASAEAMKKRAQGSSNKTIKNENVGFSGAQLCCNKDGKIVPADLKAGIALMSQMADDITLKYPKAVGLAAKSLLDKVADLDMDKSGEASQAALVEAFGGYTEALKTLLQDAGVKEATKPTGALGSNPMFDKNLGGNKLAMSPVMPGNRVIYAITEAGKEVSVGIAAAGSKEPEGDIEGKALGINDITNICDSIVSICDTIIRAGASVNDNSKVESDLDKVGDRVERLVAQADDAAKDVHKTSSTFTKMAKSVQESLREPHSSWASYALTVSNAALRYATASLGTAN